MLQKENALICQPQQNLSEYIDKMIFIDRKESLYAVSRRVNQVQRLFSANLLREWDNTLVASKIEFKSNEIMWQKKDNYFLYGKEFEITLFIQGEKDEAPTNIQKEAYISFINKKMILMSEIEEKVFEYYQTVCAEYREMYGEEADLYAPIVDEPSQLVGFVKPQSIMIPRSKDKRIINVLFKTKWDLEMGIGIQLVNERIEIVGVQSDVL